MKRTHGDFDMSTAAGQKRLMAASMGLDSETYLPRPRTERAMVSVCRPVQPSHPFVGKTVSATWRPGLSLEEVTVGVVIGVEPVTGSEKLRLAVLRHDGTTQRCYTGDTDWLISVAP